MKTKFFVGTGDNGLVKFGNKQKKKSDQCFRVLGLCDEVNVYAGYAAVSANKNTRRFLARIQEILFIAQAELAVIIFGGKNTKIITKSYVEELEQIIFSLDKKILPIHSFIVPRGSEAAMRLEIARVRAREFERELIKFGEKQKISYELKQFSNRLSSVFFALARYENKVNKVKEIVPKYK